MIRNEVGGSVIEVLATRVRDLGNPYEYVQYSHMHPEWCVGHKGSEDLDNKRYHETQRGEHASHNAETSILTSQ